MVPVDQGGGIILQKNAIGSLEQHLERNMEGR